MRWRRAARVVIALAALGFAIAVVMTMQERTRPETPPPVPRTDPEAIAESQGGTTFRVKGDEEDVRVQYERLLTYSNGASKMIAVTITADRGGRHYVVTGGEGQVGENESTIELSGGVRLEGSDGTIVTGEQATSTQTDGIVRIPGAGTFSRGKTHGSGTGLEFRQHEDVITIAENASIQRDPEDDGSGAMTLTGGSLEFKRGEREIRLDGAVTITREKETIAADNAFARLTEEEQGLELLELRGNSKITPAPGATGGLQALSARDIDLQYAPDGRVLQRAVLTGNADLRLNGEARQQPRRVASSDMTITLGPDGARPTGLVARDNVRVTLPGAPGEASRTIASRTLDGTGTDDLGLTGARFTGNVQFTEQRGGSVRTARSESLDVKTAPGFGNIEDARFARGVRFLDGPMTATSAEARYAITTGVLELTGTEPAAPTPHIADERILVDATRIDVTLDGPLVKAAGSVKSVIQPPRGDAKDPKQRDRMPSMLKGDQPVNVTANDLAYDGPASRALYSGGALLWQGETSIKARAITLESATGDLSAIGPVTTTTMLLQEVRPGEKQRVSSVGTAKDTFAYVDTLRRATYIGDAHITGPQGDLMSPRVELFLKPSGDELERVEAYDGVTLRGDGRRTTGIRLTFFGADQRYVVTGAPVTIIDECGRETTGRTLTFFRATDRIVVDGNEQIRTQTRGKSNCS
ncbi:MAG: hypothetical protein AB7Q29_14400 [Vicinamibacterales bacterium]